MPPQAERATHDFLGALGGEPPATPLAQKARRPPCSSRSENFRLLRTLVEGGAVGTASQRQAVKDAIQSARSAMTNEVLAGRRAIEQRFPGVEVHLRTSGPRGSAATAM